MPLILESMMSKRLQKTCKELRVSAVEAQEAIWALAPRDWIGKRKAAIGKVARDLGWRFSRTWNMAHGRARIIRAEEMDSLRAARARVDQLEARANDNRERLNDLIYLRHEIARAGQADRAGDPGSGSGGRHQANGREAGLGVVRGYSTKTAAGG
jgi:hypothetical protein